MKSLNIVINKSKSKNKNKFKNRIILNKGF